MDQRASHWLPLAIGLVAGLLILWRTALSPKERRSWGQWCIFVLYRTVRRCWALVRAIDVGYLEYRRFLQNTPIEIENERWMGKLIKSHRDNAATLDREASRSTLPLPRHIPD
ncbi:MAG: hypothetical protein JO211_16650 [Acidobacteriaceae bacterium]|nr:hypothetical protein [Acidobacteriaceae bacterium]